jgi:hypothetical protein
LSIAALVVNVRLYSYRGQPADDVIPQLNFIGGALRSGAGQDAQSYFPEGYFFAHALYGLAWVEVGLSEQTGTPRYDRALREARWALAQLESPAGQEPFSVGLTPPYGVFYVGWSNWLRGGILKLQPAAERDPAEVARFQGDLTALAQAFDDSTTPFLQAYPGQAWPVDSTVAVAALRLHDTLFEPRFSATIARWLMLAKQKLDPTTGLLPHRVDFQTGELLEGARATSQSIIGRFLPEVDPAWGREQYTRFRQTFVGSVLGIPGTREYPPGVMGGGDVDSGPLIAGMSLSASVVTVGAARVNSDPALADAYLNVGEALALPVHLGDQKRYAFGLLPIGDAFLAWVKSSTAWTFEPTNQAWPPSVAWGWRLPVHGLTLAIVALAWWPIWRRRKFRVMRYEV